MLLKVIFWIWQAFILRSRNTASTPMLSPSRRLICLYKKTAVPFLMKWRLATFGCSHWKHISEYHVPQGRKSANTYYSPRTFVVYLAENRKENVENLDRMMTKTVQVDNNNASAYWQPVIKFYSTNKATKVITGLKVRNLIWNVSWQYSFWFVYWIKSYLKLKHRLNFNSK